MIDICRKNEDKNSLETINMNTIDELDNFLHEKTIKHMECIENGSEVPKDKPVKLVLSNELLRIGVDILFEALMMKSVDRALNDPYLKSKSNVKNVNREEFFENIVYPILGNGKDETYH